MEFKKNAVERAKRTTVTQAAKEYGVSRSCIIRWKQTGLDADTETLSNTAQKRLPGAGRPLKDAEFDRRMLEWIRKQRKEKKRVTRKVIQVQAKTMSTAFEFKASNGWLEGFLRRHNLTTRRPTTVCQKPPADYVDQIASFVVYVEKIRQENNYDYIYASDETAVYLDCSHSKTVTEKGSKQVPVLNLGHEKAHITVMLTARNDGYKCKPYVLLPNKKPIASIVKEFGKDLELSWCKRTFFDDQLSEDYLKRVMGNSLFAKRLLVWDSYRSHTSNNTKKVLRSLKIDTAVVPGGTTKFLQPADVYWNFAFKSKIRQEYENYMLHGEKDFTKGGNLKQPPMKVYLKWVRDAWSDLPEDLIIRSFKGCGITNAPGGLEDHLIHCLKPDGEIPEGLDHLKKTRIDRTEKQLEDAMENIEVGMSEDEWDSDTSINVVD
ncbi:hypothetical protein CAEBREN_03992 [Caenorhabditis brenneri]|uniref:HTH CENPB-type domain-containing protein n=1 Tax=Caenorhabditis brenneri TaxID=135651 RepID=G0PEX4_CAEBE|nr:hypothetical protein CAEBREN_03992 [Caenorhabditis brenneri]